MKYKMEVCNLFTVMRRAVAAVMIIKKPNGWGVALDACRICGAKVPAGWTERDLQALRFGDLHSVDCDQGGCTPIGVLSRPGWRRPGD